MNAHVNKVIGTAGLVLAAVIMLDRPKAAYGLPCPPNAVIKDCTNAPCVNGACDCPQGTTACALRAACIDLCPVACVDDSIVTACGGCGTFDGNVCANGSAYTCCIPPTPTPTPTPTPAPDCLAARCAAQDALNQECPCAAATRHGQYVQCVAHVVHDLARNGTIPAHCKRAVQSCAAHSICGRPGAVPCDFSKVVPQLGPCGTLCTADSTATCCADGATPCTVDTDCVVGIGMFCGFLPNFCGGTRTCPAGLTCTGPAFPDSCACALPPSRCMIKSSAAACTAAGGSVGTSSSCCADCPTAAPTPAP